MPRTTRITKCVCGWLQPQTGPLANEKTDGLTWCEHLSKKIEENAEETDVWRGKCFSINGGQENLSDKIVAFRAAVIHHIPAGSFDLTKGRIVLARHHFPRALLDYHSTKRPAIKRPTVLLTQSEVTHVSEKDLHRSTRLKEGCNRVSTLLSKHGRQVSEKKLKDLFVQAPVSTEILRQHLHVVTCHEMAGAQIHGTTLDAGGSNANFCKLWRGGVRILGTWQGWQCVRHVNPIDPTRFICVWTCSTHNQKGIRSNLHRSRNGGTRKFKHADDVHFGWVEIEAQHQRDEVAVAEGGSRKTMLTKQSVNLDKWSVMSAVHAKAPFHTKTIDEMIDFLAGKLDCISHVFKNKTKKIKTSGVTGKPLEIPANNENKDEVRFHNALHILTAFDNEDTQPFVKSSLRTLEFQVVVHGLFIARFMNKHYQLTKANIDKEQKVVEHYLDWFNDWLEEVKREFKPKKKSKKRKRGEPSEEDEQGSSRRDKDWEKFSISKQTFSNMRIGFMGFFGYARAILNHPKGPRYVPAMHSNQSSLEALFSWIRSVGRDRVSKFAAGIDSRNAINSNSEKGVLRNNKMHDPTLVGKEQEDLDHKDLVTGNLLKKRDDKFNDWILERKCKAQSEPVKIMEEGEAASQQVGRSFGDSVMPQLRSIELENRWSFSEFLSSDKVFQEFAKLSMGSESEGFFQAICTNALESETNSMCHRFMSALWNCLKSSVSVKDKSKAEASYHFQLLTFLCSKEMNESIDKQEGELRNRIGSVVVVQLLSRHLIRKWIPLALEKVKSNLTSMEKVAPAPASEEGKPTVSTGVLAAEVNRFCGAALRKMMQHVQSDLVSATGEKEDKLKAKLQVLLDMRVFEQDILDDPQYISRFYSNYDALRNEGFLTLIKPKFAPVCLRLLVETAENSTEEAFLKHGNLTGKLVHEQVKNNDGIKNEFMALWRGASGLTEDDMVGLHDEFCERVVNAFFGDKFKRFKSKIVGRGGKDENSTRFRTQLKESSAKKQKNKKRKRQDDLDGDEG